MLDSASSPGTAVVATRTKPATVFAALHEPFEGGADRAPSTRFDAIARTGGALAVTVRDGQTIDDRILLAYGRQIDRPIRLSANGESFTFTGHAWLRIAADKVIAHGSIAEMKLNVPGRPNLILNNKPAPTNISGRVMTYRAKK